MTNPTADLTTDLTKMLAELWSEDARVREAACDALVGLAVDNVDLRRAQPALVWLMRDPDPRVRLAAVRVTEMRADLGCDVGLAVPALIELASDDDDDLRACVWRTLRHASARTPFLHRLPGLLERGLADRDPRVAEHARVLRDRARG